MINVSELDKNIKKLVQYGINSGLILNQKEIIQLI